MSHPENCSESFNVCNSADSAKNVTQPSVSRASANTLPPTRNSQTLTNPPEPSSIAHSYVSDAGRFISEQPETNANTVEDDLPQFVNPAELVLEKRDPICARRTIVRPLAHTQVETRLESTLTIWVDSAGTPADGQMIIAVSEEKSTGEKPFEDGQKILEILSSYWTAPNEDAFERGLDLIFAVNGELMRDRDLWGSRKEYSRKKLRPTVITVCREAYRWYAKDFAAAVRAGKYSGRQ